MAATDPSIEKQPVLVSVITTLLFPRHDPLRCLESWTKDQKFTAGDIELIVVVNGRRKKLERELPKVLRPCDRVVFMDTRNEMALYDAGARAAGGLWLLFTEPHVIAMPDCVSELVRHVTQNSLAGACVRTLPGGEPNKTARMEARMYLQDAETWTRDDDWRKFTKRGTMVSRAAYLACGGFDHSHLRYAEITLAAKLHQLGHRLGFAPGATIRHFNSTTLTELLHYVWEYRRMERRVSRERPDLPCSSKSTAVSTAFTRQMAARPLFRGILEQARHLRDTTARRTLVHLSRLWLRAVAGRVGDFFDRGLSSVSLASRFLLTWLGYRLARDDDTAYTRYLRLWQLFGDLSAATDALEEEVAVPPPHAASLAASELEHGWGLHRVESLDGVSFRWTDVFTLVPLAAAETPDAMVLNILPVRPLKGRDVTVTWDEVPLVWKGSLSTATRLVFVRKMKKLASAPHSGTSLLAIMCPPVPDPSPGETRALGLPLVSIEPGVVQPPAANPLQR